MFRIIKKLFSYTLVVILCFILASIIFLINNIPRHLIGNYKVLYNLTTWYIDGGEIKRNLTNFEEHHGETKEYIKIFPEEYPGHDRIREQLRLVSSLSR
jgi:hypothetical protein